MNVNNNPNRTKTPGFWSGTYKDGSAVYPGTGNFPSCPGVNPARITTSNNDQGPGAYIGCNREHLFDSMEAKYFAAHPKLKWVRTDTSRADNVPGAIKVYWSQSGGYDFVARVTLPSGKKLFQQIGFYWKGDVCYWDGNFWCRTGDFEILACID